MLLLPQVATVFRQQQLAAGYENYTNTTKLYAPGFVYKLRRNDHVSAFRDFGNGDMLRPGPPTEHGVHCSMGPGAAAPFG